ncbi:MAG: AAA family ATPase, partial [Thermoleophilia bacterium]|nr:AAA family ATPase [Thermoleophilia bacterium]
MLKRLRIKGFKSFADPVDLEFGPGLNVIVGPNGSGKSNVSEAIAWALGEQRAGRLRAPAMQDILFSGGDGRQPVGMAEVAVTLEGGMGDGPAELGVSRRLTRAGDSGYRLNGSSVRLVDVLDSLSTRGLGPQSLSIIRQGQVDAICQSKPAELRGILDEAAGTGLPKRRRHRAELRLKHVDEHLARARDLAGEITARARSLERQARAAERAAEVERELGEAREALITARARAAGRDLADARAARAARAHDVAEATTALEAARAAVSAASAERAAVIAEREGAMQSAARMRGVAERLAGRAEVATGRVAAAAEEAQRRRERRLEAQQALVAAESAARDAEQAVARAEQAAHAAAERLEHAEQADQSAVAALEAAREQQRVIERDAAERAAIQGRVVRATEAMSALEGAGGPDVARAERRAEVSLARRGRDAEMLAAAGRRADAARSAREGAAARAARLAAEAAALAPTEDRHPDAVLLGDGIEVLEGMERAVAAALGELADAPLVDSVPAGARALEGGASAAAVTRPVAAAAVSAPPLPGARPLASLITACPDRARPWLDGLLVGAWLVDSLEGLPEGLDARVLVTSEGLA